MAIVVAAAILPAGAAAQTTGGVDAGSLKRQGEQLQGMQALPAGAGRAAATGMLAAGPRPGVAEGGPRIFVSAWAFEGNDALTDEVLAAALAAVTGRDLTFAEIDAAVARIGALYAGAGLLAEVTLPEQEVIGGRVRLKVQEARFGGVTFEAPEPERVGADRIARVFETQVPVGDLVLLDRLDSALLLADDLPGVSISGAFAPGRRPGETVLVLSTATEDPATLQVGLDNFGGRATGIERTSLQGTLVSPLKFGDLARVVAAKTEGSDSLQASYSFPVGARGARVAASLGRLDYEIVSPEMRDAGLSGQSRTGRISISYPVIRTRDGALTLSVTRDWAALGNLSQGESASDYDVAQTGLGLSGYWFDQIGGGGASSAALSFASGAAKGRTASEGAFDDGFDIWRYSLTRQQTLGRATTLFVALSGQKGPRGLDSSEGFSLGGPAGVRAYPVGEAAGASGALATLELRHRLSQGWLVKGFYDHGRVADRDAEGEPDRYDLKGLGVAVEWSGPDGWLADLTLARRVGSNPNAIPASDPARADRAGNDQDGSLDRTRIWLSVKKTF